MCDNMNLQETTEDSEKLGGTTPVAKLSKWLYVLHNKKIYLFDNNTISCTLRLNGTEFINFASRKKCRHEDYLSG